MQTIDVRGYIVKHYTPYTGDDSFLAGPTARTLQLLEKVKKLMADEFAAGGVLDIDADTISTITAFAPGYIDRELETIVGLQTDAPLRRAIMPYGGIRMVESELETYGREVPARLKDIFQYRKTHNDGVFDCYTDEIKAARRAGVITGLPDAYGRGRIIGDYRRVALYGVDALIAQKQEAKDKLADHGDFTETTIRQMEELADQLRALEALKQMAASYGYDISKPATNFQQAVQWLYFGYLAAIKEQNGAAMSMGRVSTFLDIYAEADLKAGRLTEEQVQEIVDCFVLKLRMVRFLRTKEYDALFSGDPVWVTECIGGMCLDGRPMVTKMSFRFLHTLTNMGPAPEPNLTVLWSPDLPENFKNYCARQSIATSSIQYESDEIMREKFGDDYGIACCVSPMRLGKQMQFFGARANLAKCLLYSINGGRDEISGEQIAPELPILDDVYLDYEKVVMNYDKMQDWLAKTYINALNIIHYMHDKYDYEALEMALHDEDIHRTMACGIAGLSVAADSLSAIRYAKVKPIRNEKGLAVDFEITGEFPCFGNNDDRVDEIACHLVEHFMGKLRSHQTYRDAEPTMSILTITSNVVYGKKTGTTPDGRPAGAPFAPGANPMHNRDKSGALASLSSVAKLPFDSSQDGISYTFSILPDALGRTEQDKVSNLITLLDGYIKATGHHINVNVLQREVLREAMAHPEQYPQLTVRISGYAVNFIKLTREQQEEFLARTFHEHF